MNRNYWMFRVSNKWGYRTKFCFDNNLVYCGWNMRLSIDERSQILKTYPEASRMAIKFTYINPNDVIIMPVSGGIAVGIAEKIEYRPDLDWEDTIKVKWLVTFYPRKNLTSRFQSSLKYFGTFLNLSGYEKEIEELIENEFDSIDDVYQSKKRRIEEESLEYITKHLNSLKKLKFQDREFENFILHLLELNYEGLKGEKNNQRQEALDGKDLTMKIDFDDFNINISFNVQVKQHTGNADFGSLFQISKSDDSDPFIKNVVVTTGFLNQEIRNKAKEMNIILFGPEEIATMIIDNFDSIDDKYYPKLDLMNRIN